MGNPISAVSLTFGATVSGLDPFGDAGSFSVSASRMVYASATTLTFLGASVSELGGWGVSKSIDPKGSIYATTVGDLSMGAIEVPFEVTMGYGQDVRTNKKTGALEDSGFWGVGLGIAPGVAASLSGTNNQLNVGATVAIPGLSGVGVTMGVSDVTNNTNRRQTSITVGYGISLFGGAK